MRTWVVVWMVALALLFPRSVIAEPPPGNLEFVDLTDNYDRIWHEAQKLPAEARPAFLRRQFAAIIPGFYDHKRLADFGVTSEQYDAFVGKMMDNYPTKRADIARTAAGFRTLFDPAVKSFESEFGPMRDYPPIYLVVAHNEFDGGTRDLPEGTRLMFGADVIAKLYRDKPIQPFFHHELFHLRHARTFPECSQLWCSLWAEGLAVHVAKSLNPDASDEALLLTSPVPLRPAVEANRAAAVCAVLARLDSEKPEDYAPLFMGGSGDPVSPELPKRFGYFVGYLVASDIGRNRSLNALADLPPGEVRPLVERSLRTMASCGEGRGERG